MRTLLKGLATFVGAVVVGVGLLAAIGWMFPRQQDSRPLDIVLSLISLAMYAAVARGIWLIAKGLLGFR